MIWRKVLLVSLLSVMLLWQPCLCVQTVTYLEGDWQNTVWIQCPPCGCVGKGPFLILHLENVFIGVNNGETNRCKSCNFEGTL